MRRRLVIDSVRKKRENDTISVFSSCDISIGKNSEEDDVALHHLLQTLFKLIYDDILYSEKIPHQQQTIFNKLIIIK